ncbi:Alpha/Beta hydrolase protein [Crepidotus variabilis]|uniref:Alpha/Beta hydrolase protein n=1 Tax=Crepidotus variabilis TaxID=179855 RepID=A0A9P6EGT3_9AGAR|nr:Alpha/Beta hydrolase protein [Crepidotus variabilis]
MTTNGTATLSGNLKLAYIDSGLVEGSNNYTTVILLHGSTFNAYTYDRVHELASPRNLRTIAVQRREYPGSTPYTDEEIDDIKNGRQVFIDRTAILMAEFIQFVAQTLKVPEVSENGSSGGIALLGWSIGAVTAMAPLSKPELLPNDLRTTLEKYFRMVIMLDPPHYAHGFTLPDSLTFVIPAQLSSLEAFYESFKGSVIGYYNTPEGWGGDISLLDRRTPAEAAYTPHAWSTEDYAKRYTIQAGVRSEFFTQLRTMKSIFEENSRRALFNEHLAQTFCPRVSIGILSVGRSHWICQYSAYRTQELYKELTEKGEKLRPLKVYHIQCGNHFTHYHYPEDFMDGLKALLS